MVDTETKQGVTKDINPELLRQDDGVDVKSVRSGSVVVLTGVTKRGLSSRHVQLMAIAGSIGTALFVGIGSPLSTAGPLSLVLGYLFWSLFFVLPCTLSVAEMCAYLPIRGSILELADRYIDPALGFSMGWTYFYGGVMLVCVEYSAVATVMQYCTPTSFAQGSRPSR